MKKDNTPSNSDKTNHLFDNPMFNYDLLDGDDTELQEVYDLLKQTDNEINLVLSYTLFVEYEIDRLLKSWIPGYQELKGNRDFTFSLKTELLRSFRFMPNYILNNVDLIRKIRNEFAHNIEINKIEKVDKKLLNKVDSYLKESYKKGVALPNLVKDKFIGLVNVTILNLSIYGVNIKRLNETIRSKEFIEQLYKTNIEETFKRLPLKKRPK